MQETLRNWIHRKLAENESLSKSGLAQALNVSRTHLYHLLTDDHTPRHTDFTEQHRGALENYLGIIPEEVLAKTKFKAPVAAKIAKRALETAKPQAYLDSGRKETHKGKPQIAAANEKSFCGFHEKMSFFMNPENWPRLSIAGFARANTDGAVEIIGGGKLDDKMLMEMRLPLPFTEGMVGYKVIDHCMAPQIPENAVVVCFAEQRRPLDYFFGRNAVVKVGSRYYLKRIEPGTQPGTAHLISLNGRTMRDVRVDWLGEIFAIIPSPQELNEYMQKAPPTDK